MTSRIRRKSFLFIFGDSSRNQSDSKNDTPISSGVRPSPDIGTSLLVPSPEDQHNFNRSSSPDSISHPSTTPPASENIASSLEQGFHSVRRALFRHKSSKLSSAIFNHKKSESKTCLDSNASDKHSSLDSGTSIVFPSVVESPALHDVIDVNTPPNIVVSPPSAPTNLALSIPPPQQEFRSKTENPSSLEAEATLSPPAKVQSIDNDVTKLPATKRILSSNSPPPPPSLLSGTLPPSKHTHKPVMVKSDSPKSNDPIPAKSSSDPSQTPSRWKNITEASLDSILSTKEGFISVTKLKGNDAISVIDLIDEVLESTRPNARKQKKYIATLRKLCGNSGILPTSHTLTEGLKRTGVEPRAGGGFAEVWEGLYNGKTVAIKALRTYSSQEQAKVKKRFCKEALMWKRLSHTNVLPFIGALISESSFWMVSPWMVNGNINDYIKSDPQTNRIPLLYDISNGLDCLHSKDIVHGDLKGANILINEDRRACLADFGLTTIIADAITDYSITVVDSPGTVRWMAPQLLVPEEYGLDKCTLTKESDIYALGMVMYEVITEDTPFSQYKNFIVVQKVVAGDRPERPTNATATELVDSVWPIAEACWRQQHRERPTIAEVLERLNVANGDGVPPSPTETEAVTRNGSDDDDSDESLVSRPSPS